MIDLISQLPVFLTLLEQVWNRIIGIVNLSFLGVSDGGLVIAFVRVLVWIMVFTVFFAGLRYTPHLKDLLKKNQALVVAFVLATISAIFLPADALLALGAGWGTLVALVLIGIPVVAILAALIMTPSSSRGVYFIKFCACLLLYWILMAMKFHIGRL